jgi:hypothetical protein
MLASYTLVLTTTIALSGKFKDITGANGYGSQDLVPNGDQSFALVWFQTRLLCSEDVLPTSFWDA